MAAVLGLPPAAALAVAPPGGARARPLLDRSASAPAGPRTLAARAALRRELGPGLALGLDARSGATRVVQRLDGALTRPSSLPRARVAQDWVREHRALFGLDAAAADALGVTSTRTTGRSGITTVRLGRRAGGVPVFDGGLTVALDRGGRVLTVTGEPGAASAAAPPAAVLDARAARAALVAQLGPTTPAAPAEAVAFPTARGIRPAWRLLERRSSSATWSAVVDATDGTVLFRQDLTKAEAPALTYPNHPGAEDTPATAGANAPREVDLEAQGWLPAGAPRLEGPAVRAFSDLDDDDVADPDEEVLRRPAGDFRFTFVGFPGPGCGPPGARCTWDPADPGSWATNREQNGVQAFALANRFRDHLRRPEIGFDGFSGDDPIVLQTRDGAALGDPAHRNNANMTVLPEGRSPKMQMYLFGGGPFRAIDGGDDAATLWHEHAHGLSGRLVTHSDGTSALSSVQAGALGEAWSDFYALDLLSRDGLLPDGPAPGEMDLGVASDLQPHTSRSQGADCPVGAASPGCPGRPGAGTGGYTLGDFGRISGAGPEVHYDGEVWLEALWDLRTALVAASGSEAAGSDLAERLITDGMRLGPPEPSFVDARNAIFAAATAAGLDDPASRELLWRVFAARGLGLYAHTADATDTLPVPDDRTPATAGPDGTVRGRVTDAAGGLPLPGARIASDAPDGRTATSGPDGGFALALPSGSYPGLSVTGPAGYDPEAPRVDVPAGDDVALDVPLRRNWASGSGGARIVGDVQDEPCGPGQLVDDLPASGWSSVPGHRSLVLELPTPVDVTQVGIDPSPTCGDGGAAGLAAFTLTAIAQDGQERVMASQSTPVVARQGAFALRVPSNAREVSRIRLTLDAAAGSDSTFVDVSRLALYGTRSDGAPRGSLRATPSVVEPREPVAFDASSFTDPDSLIASYSWDFDGDGRTDRVTSDPTTSFAFDAPGARDARVVVRDVGGADGRASTGVVVRRPGPVVVTVPAPPTPPPVTRTVLPPAPSIAVSPRGRRAIRVTTRCASRCSLRVTGVVGPTTARRLGRRARSVLATSRSASVGGTVALGLDDAVLRAAKRRRVRTFTVAVRVTVTDARKRVAVKRASVRVAL